MGRRVFLVRHGETEENLAGIHQGQSLGGTLSHQGVKDVRELGRYLSHVPVTRLFVSPMQRCRATAALLADYVRPTSLQTEPRLAAKNSGYLGGRPRELAAAEASRLGIPIHQLRPTGGESSVDVYDRHAQLWAEVRALPEDQMVLVGHGGGIACLLLHLTGLWFDRYLDHVPGSACFTVIDIAESRRDEILVMNAAPGSGLTEADLLG